MITNKQIDRALRFARPVLDSHFDRQKVQTLLDKMKANQSRNRDLKVHEYGH